MIGSHFWMQTGRVFFFPTFVATSVAPTTEFLCDVYLSKSPVLSCKSVRFEWSRYGFKSRTERRGLCPSLCVYPWLLFQPFPPHWTTRRSVLNPACTFQCPPPPGTGYVSRVAADPRSMLAKFTFTPAPLWVPLVLTMIGQYLGAYRPALHRTIH